MAIIGQAPGRRAQASGVPWDDVSGDNLRKWLGVTKEQFYDPGLFALLPMDFYFRALTHRATAIGRRVKALPTYGIRRC